METTQSAALTTMISGRRWNEILRHRLRDLDTFHGRQTTSATVQVGATVAVDIEELTMGNRHDFFKDRLTQMGLYDPDSDYNGDIGRGVEMLSAVFSAQHHSGMSAHIVRGVFNQLMDEWEEKGK